MNLKLKQVRIDHNKSLQDIADAAKVSRTEVYEFELGILPQSEQETKEKIVRALSRLTNQPYTLSDLEYTSPPEQPFTPLITGYVTDPIKGEKQV